MQKELSFDDIISDPLIGQLRQADGISTIDFARLMTRASETYRASRISRLHTQRADLFYRTIGAGELQLEDNGEPPGMTASKIDTAIGC